MANGFYSISVNSSLGTAYASMNAPGDIHFNGDGSQVWATYRGNIDQAQVSRFYPAAVTTFVSTPGVDVGSPFSYPSSAFDSPSYPATFYVTYSAGMTTGSFTGTAGAFGGFVGENDKTQMFTR